VIPLARKLLSFPPAKRAALRLLAKKGEPLRLGFVLHTEMIYDGIVFERLKSLGASLPFKPMLCVMTPKNPYIKHAMEQRGVSEVEFNKRLRTLSERYEVGFHGHWCTAVAASAPAADRKHMTRIEKAGFALTIDNPEEIRKQFKSEVGYLAAQGYKPAVYSAGWWHLNESVVGLLDEHGFSADCSVRYPYADSFGKRYITPEKLPPQGDIFYLPPSKQVRELHSVFYLHMKWWTLVKELLPVLRRKEGPLFCVLPTHDYDLVEGIGKVKENIEFLSRLPNVQWLSMSDILREAGRIKEIA